jgi:retron-type reverse transcriptase
MRAYLQVVRNKGAAGIDGMTVEGLGAYLSKKRRKHQGTAAGQGSTSRSRSEGWRYQSQTVEQGTLGVPTVVDRFVQQAVAQVLTPIFEEQFHDHSYGFRPNRCAQQGSS